MNPLKVALIILFVIVGLFIITLLVVEVILLLLGQKNVNKSNVMFRLLKTIFLKYDINNKELVFFYRGDKLNKNNISLSEFEASLTSSKLKSWHEYIDKCTTNDGAIDDPLEIQLLKNNEVNGIWYDLKFERYNKEKNEIFFVLNKQNRSTVEVNNNDFLTFSEFKSNIRSLCDDAYNATGTLICINLTAYDNLVNRYSIDIATTYLYSLLNDLNILNSKNTLISSDRNYFWIYKHGLTKKSAIRSFMKKIKNTLAKQVEYEDLILNVEYVIGYTILGKFTFSVDIAINQAIQACQSKLSSVFGISKEFLEFDETMEKQNSSNYLDYQSLNQLINKQEYIPVFNYMFSLYNGVVNEFFIELNISSTHFKDYSDAYECAVQNKMLDSFIAAGFKSTLNEILKQKISSSNSFIYMCDINHVTSLIDIYDSSDDYKAYSFIFAITNFDYISKLTTYNEIKDKLMFYKDKGIKFAIIVDERMKMISHPLFSLFDAFIIPPNLYKDIKIDEKAKLNAIRMIEVLPTFGSVIVIGVNDKIEVEILMNGDIDFICGPLVGSTLDLKEKPDIIALRKLQSLIKFKESID